MTAEPAFVWVDCESTGLDADSPILELALVATDGDLNEIGDPYRSLVQPDSFHWAHCWLSALEGNPTAQAFTIAPVVVEMHRDSGLTDALALSWRTHTLPDPAQVECAAQEWLDVTVGDRVLPLAGVSLRGADRIWLAAQMPDLHNRFHYRSLDVTTVRLLAERWRPALFLMEPDGVKAHRALPDVRDSINLLRWYREHFFREAP